MTPERFETLAEAFGGDVAVWPAAEREAAAAFMAAEPARAGAILAEAEALDSALAAFSPPRAASGLMDRIVAGAPMPRVMRWWSGWLAPAGMGAGLAAACAAGVVLGARMSAPAVAPDDALITAVSDDDVGFDFDEEA
jgi:hypothetical protein